METATGTTVGTLTVDYRDIAPELLSPKPLRGIVPTLRAEIERLTEENRILRERLQEKSRLD